MKPTKACPCCDHTTFSGYGTHEICPVCFWQNDGSDMRRLHRWSMANAMTLATARVNFVALGACHALLVPHVVPVAERARFR